MIADVVAHYDERCTACGARFRIERIVSESESFRLLVSVESLQKSEILDLLLDGTRVMPLDAEQAQAWASAYSWVLASGKTYAGYRDFMRAAVSLRPASESHLPAMLEPGQRWSGWLESSKPLPDGTTAFIPIIGPITREGRFFSHYSHDKRRPFVGLNGDVVVEPLTGLKKLQASAAYFGRSLRATIRDPHSVSVLVSPLVAIAVGVQAGAPREAYFALPFLGLFIGDWLGSRLKKVLAERRGRATLKPRSEE